MHLAALALVVLVAPAHAGKRKKKQAPEPIEVPAAAPATSGTVVLPCPYGPGRTYTWDVVATGSNPATGTVRFTGLEGSPGTVHVRVQSTVERPAVLSSSVVDEALARLPEASAPVVSFEPATRGLAVTNLDAVVRAMGPALEGVLAERYGEEPAPLVDYTRQLARDPGMVTSAVLQGKAILFLQTCAEAPIGEPLEQRIQMPSPIGGQPIAALSTYLVQIDGDHAVIQSTEASEPGAMGSVVDGMVAAELLDPEVGEELRDFRMASSARTEVGLADGVVRSSSATLTIEGAGLGRETEDVRTFTLRE
jgi:hypothetical protein